MRLWILAIFLMLGMSISAQKQINLDDTFLRVYNHGGKKIAKGSLVNITYENLLLKKGARNVEVNAKDVGFIRTKKTKGNTILMGTLIGTGAGAAVGATQGDPDNFIFPTSSGEAAVLGGLAGALIGAPIGALVSLTKSSETITINGDPEAWKDFMARFTGKHSVNLNTTSPGENSN